jgi:hypothetical protein
VDASGLQVVTVREPNSQADRYAAEQLFPAFQEFGLAPGMMPMTDYDAASSASGHRMCRVHGPGRTPIAPAVGGPSAELVLLREARFGIGNSDRRQMSAICALVLTCGNSLVPDSGKCLSMAYLQVRSSS